MQWILFHDTLVIQWVCENKNNSFSYKYSNNTVLIPKHYILLYFVHDTMDFVSAKQNTNNTPPFWFIEQQLANAYKMRVSDVTQRAGSVHSISKTICLQQKWFMLC